MKTKDSTKEKDLVVQCAMKDPSGREHVAFIPKALARKGNPVKIDAVAGDWTVTETYATATCAEANERSRDFDKQREFSDA